MSAKRALVVDDSKSARAFLSRILERHEISVDAAESAEQAIDYLTRNKPDVIFMDHMMPGMDGFQAVQSIKNNPRTAQIPILMYTSQEGDLYLGQARALGAEGVLPKQIKQADVTKLLFDLRLVADRRTVGDIAATALAPANEAIRATPPALSLVVSRDEARQPEKPAAEPPADKSEAPRTDIAALMPQLTLEIRAEIAKLQTFIGSTLDSHSERLQGDLSALLPASRTPEIDTAPLIPERRGAAAIVGWTLAVIASAAAAALGSMWWNQGGEIAALRTDLAAAYAEVETLRARPVVSPAPVAAPQVLPADTGVEGAALAPVDGAAVVPTDPLAPVTADPETGAPAAVAAPTPAASSANPASVAPAPVVPASSNAATPVPAPAGAPAR
jgi:CheY-like chemotaxis protein